MNQERPNETKAKQIVERAMGIQLGHADTHGGVDYLSIKGTVALEVTAVTEGARKSSRDALSRSKAKGSPTTRLQRCWLVFVADTHPETKSFVQRVQPMVADLEFAGETYFNQRRAKAHVDNKGELSHVYLPLLDAGVDRAVPVPHSQSLEESDHVHRIRVSAGSGGGSVSSSDESLSLLMEALNEKTDNPLKLHASGAEQRHLFVWLDDDTSYNIACPLSREAPSWADAGWGLPTTSPHLDPAISHLWVVHAQSLLGWLWDGAKWNKLRDL